MSQNHARYQKGWCLQFDIVVTWDSQRLKVTDGDEETPLNAIGPYEMKVLLKEVLDTSKSLYLIISYLQMCEYGRLVVIVPQSVG